MKTNEDKLREAGYARADESFARIKGNPRIARALAGVSMILSQSEMNDEEVEMFRDEVVAIINGGLNDIREFIK